jgi:hypothetical protein
MVTKVSWLTILVFALTLFACGQATSDSIKPGSSSQDKPYDGTPDGFEVRQTEKLLGVLLQTFPEPQGPTKFDELPPTRPALQFTVKEQPVSGPTPQPFYETRSLVKAKAPDGSIYEAYCTRNSSEVILGSQPPSTMYHTREMHDTHHGYGFSPSDVFIGKRVGSRIKTDLMFPDVGEHDTAPHHLAIDSKGMVHLIVADVNISQANRLDLYWVIGDPRTGKWTAAWLVDRRDFIGSSHPWSGASTDKVNLVWLCEKQGLESSPDDGIFHLEWQPGGFGQKVRVIKGKFRGWDAAVDPQSGRLLLVYSDKDRGVYITSRPEGGTWTTPVRLHKSLTKPHDVSAIGLSDGTFIIRTTYNYKDTREWVVRLL